MGARVGNLRDLLGEDQAPAEKKNEGSNKEESKDGKTEDESQEDGSGNGSGSSTADKKGQPAAGPWWNREEKVITEVRSHLKWVADTRQLLESGVRTLEAIEVPASVQERCCFSMKISRPVLAERQHNRGCH